MVFEASETLATVLVASISTVSVVPAGRSVSGAFPLGKVAGNVKEVGVPVCVRKPGSADCKSDTTPALFTTV
jgi:hypothetical protein